MMPAHTSTSPDGDELQQMNVKIKKGRVRLAKRIAARRGESLQEYIEYLIEQDIAREQQAFLADLEAWQDKARREAEEAAQDVADAVKAAQRR